MARNTCIWFYNIKKKEKNIAQNKNCGILLRVNGMVCAHTSQQQQQQQHSVYGILKTIYIYIYVIDDW